MALSLHNVQPFVAGYRFGSFAVAHNGNFTNYASLRGQLEEMGSIFNTTSDTEVVLHLIAMSKSRPFESRLIEACHALEGAFSMVFLNEDELVAVRDPFGFRPLVVGRIRDSGGTMVASETCAFDPVGADYEEELEADENGVVKKSCLNRKLDGIFNRKLTPNAVSNKV